MDRDSWDERYRATTVWSGAPNPAIVTYLGDLAPEGLALDLGCGEGADALWLAGRGWQVVGVDWSGVALDRARAAGQEAGVDVRFVQGDLTDSQFLSGLAPVRGFDLVTVAFVHPEPEERGRTYRHLAGLLAPGGRLLVVAHDPAQADLGLPGPPLSRLMSVADILASLDLPSGVAVESSGTSARTREGGVVAVDAVVLARRTDDSA